MNKAAHSVISESRNGTSSIVGESIRKPATAGDAFSEVVERAVEAGVRKALKVNEIGERRLLSVEEVATYLCLSKREVYNTIVCGELKAVPHGRRKMLDIRDLDEWIERKKR